MRALRHQQFETIAESPAFLQQIAVNLTRDFARHRKTEAGCLGFGRLPEDALRPKSCPMSAWRPTRNRVSCAAPSRRCRRAAARFLSSTYLTSCRSTKLPGD